MKEIRCHDWVPKKEDWKVYSNHIIISFFSIKFKSKPSYIPKQIRWALWSNCSRKSCEKWCLLSNLLKESSLCKLSHIFCDFKEPMSTLTLSVGSSLRNPLSIELLNFVHKMEILQNHWSSSSSSHYMWIIINWTSTCSSKHTSIQWLI